MTCSPSRSTRTSSRSRGTTPRSSHALKLPTPLLPDTGSHGTRAPSPLYASTLSTGISTRPVHSQTSHCWTVVVNQSWPQLLTPVWSASTSTASTSSLPTSRLRTLSRSSTWKSSTDSKSTGPTISPLMHMLLLNPLSWVHLAHITRRRRMTLVTGSTSLRVTTSLIWLQ